MMKKFLTITTSSAFILVAFLMTGCSSDDSSPGSSVASITDANAQALAIAGTEGIKQAVNNDNASPFAKIANTPNTQSLTVALAQNITPNTSQALIPNVCSSGTLDQTLNESGSGTITFSECVIGAATYNGSAAVSSTTSGAITTSTITYINFTVTTTSGTESIDLTSVCTINNSTFDVSCTFNSSALGIDGRTYSVSGVSISGTGSSGYTVSATVTDPDHGSIVISTNIPVTFIGCSNNQPNAGEISITGGGSNMTATFNSCTSYTVTFNGVANLYNW